MPEKQDLLELFKLNRTATRGRRDAAVKRYDEAAAEINFALRRAGVESTLIQDLRDASQELVTSLGAIAKQERAEADAVMHRPRHHLFLLVGVILGAIACAAGIWVQDVYSKRGMLPITVTPQCVDLHGGKHCEFWLVPPTEPAATDEGAAH